MQHDGNAAQREREGQLFARAAKDAAFRWALVADPTGTLERELGMTVPAGVTISVLEETPTRRYLVLPPAELLPMVVPIDGEPHHVVRFTAAVVNAGPGPLELRGEPASGRTWVSQRVYDAAGGVAESPVGSFVYHPAHDHWHFEHFAAYELWARAEYEAWLASGRRQGRPGWQGTKTTGQQLEGESFCVRDSRPMPQVAAGPAARRYTDCGAAEQGISVGWADVYPQFLPEQWIDLGDAPLPDGEYVLRVVADPLNLLLESPDKADPARESGAANEGVTSFSVRQGCPDAALLALPGLLVCRDGTVSLEDIEEGDDEVEPPARPAPAQVPAR
jgi:hypothetical protein